MTIIHHNFAAIDAQLDSMSATNAQLTAVREELDAELTHWASYWEGAAHEQASVWSRGVTHALDATIIASQQYVEKARVANADMGVQEATATSMWS